MYLNVGYGDPKAIIKNNNKQFFESYNIKSSMKYPKL